MSVTCAVRCTCHRVGARHGLATVSSKEKACSHNCHPNLLKHLSSVSWLYFLPRWKPHADPHPTVALHRCPAHQMPHATLAAYHWRLIRPMCNVLPVSRACRAERTATHLCQRSRDPAQTSTMADGGGGAQVVRKGSTVMVDGIDAGGDPTTGCNFSRTKDMCDEREKALYNAGILSADTMWHVVNRAVASFLQTPCGASPAPLPQLRNILPPPGTTR